MINFYKYDVIVVKFPFVGTLKYKARPAVVISNIDYNTASRNTLIVLAISSQIDTKLDFEIEIEEWDKSGLLKPSIFKSLIMSIDINDVITKIGSLTYKDKESLDKLINKIL